MMDFCAHAHRRDPSTFTLLVTQPKVELARRRLLAKGIRETDCLVTSATPAEVPRYLRAADVALSFIKPCYSKQASSPTKVAEYLAAGLPVVSNAGIGDLDELIGGERIGVILRDFTPQAYEKALDEREALGHETAVRARCQTVAHDQFDLRRVGGHRYRRLYERLLSCPDTPINETEGLGQSVTLSYLPEGER
jgi:glycosyltransferase involved in cell wall biosynthesis